MPKALFHALVGGALLLAPAISRLASARPSELPLPEATTNDNTKPAGMLRGGVLSVSMFAAVARWRPGPADAPPVETILFGEEGKAPSNPGPLLRMPLGTRVELTMRNDLRDTLLLMAACGYPCQSRDTLRVAPGARGHLSFTPPSAGTFVYWGVVVRRGQPVFAGDEDSQSAGVIVVDSGPPRPDRIITVSTYDHVRDTTDESKGLRLLFAFNGRVWPYTERFTHTVGDSVRWRIVNLGGGEHPLHLHGFYFRVESRGDGGTDQPIPPAEQPLVVTQEIGTLGTFQMVWSPDRPGNWLFHCHKPIHMGAFLNDMLYDRNPDMTHGGAMPHGDHARDGMGGLVLGITVRPAKGVEAAGGSQATISNRLRLIAQRIAASYGPEETLGYALQRAGQAVAAEATAPGPVVTVTRGERTQITVVNHLTQPTAVHWHGIELESYFDGVVGWSGADTRLAPMIAPADSFVAVFTPPRAGTFIYHTHMNDLRQLSAGLYGPLVVLEPGETWNAATDHAFAVGQSGFDAPAWTVVNGIPARQPLRLKAGVPHRFRFLSMTLDEETDVTIERGDSVSTWTPLAKDAIPVPASQRAPRPARLHFGPGETYDFEFTPTRGVYQMKVMSLTNVLITIVAR